MLGYSCRDHKPANASWRVFCFTRGYEKALGLISQGFLISTSQDATNYFQNPAKVQIDWNRLNPAVECSSFAKK